MISLVPVGECITYFTEEQMQKGSPREERNYKNHWNVLLRKNGRNLAGPVHRNTLLTTHNNIEKDLEVYFSEGSF